MQTFLLFGLDKWVVNPCIGRIMGGFQQKVDLRLTGKKPLMFPDRGYEDPPPLGGGDEVVRDG